MLTLLNCHAGQQDVFWKYKTSTGLSVVACICAYGLFFPPYFEQFLSFVKRREDQMPSKTAYPAANCKRHFLTNICQTKKDEFNMCCVYRPDCRLSSAFWVWQWGATMSLCTLRSACKDLRDVALCASPSSAFEGICISMACNHKP